MATMPPRKKAKNNNKPLTQTANSMADVPGILLSAKKTLEQLWEMRHGYEGDGKQSLEAPFLCGGHFKAIAQRAWTRPAELLSKSHAMVVAAGIIDKDTTMEQFADNYMRLKVFWTLFTL